MNGDIHVAFDLTGIDIPSELTELNAKGIFLGFRLVEEGEGDPKTLQYHGSRRSLVTNISIIEKIFGSIEKASDCLIGYVCENGLLKDNTNGMENNQGIAWYENYEDYYKRASLESVSYDLKILISDLDNNYVTIHTLDKKERALYEKLPKEIKDKIEVADNYRALASKQFNEVSEYITSLLAEKERIEKIHRDRLRQEASFAFNEIIEKANDDFGNAFFPKIDIRNQN